MAELVIDCPRCASKRITADVKSSNFLAIEHRWKLYYELFGVCRQCSRSTIFKVALENEASSKSEFYQAHSLVEQRGALNQDFEVLGYVSLKDRAAVETPRYLPEDISAAFNEAATCIAVQCWNASAAMFRLCIDLATKPMLPAEDVNGLNRRIRRDLGLRLPWLFDNNLLPNDLRELAKCIREDGNDGAHAGTLTKADAEDLLDFSFVLLDRIYTEKERLRLAEERRLERRKPQNV